MPPTTLTILGLIMPAGFQDAEGNVYPAAFASPAAMTQDIIDEAGGIPWNVYGSTTAAENGKQPCAEHTTQVDKAEFFEGAEETVAQLVAEVNLPGLTVDTLTEAQNTALICISFGMSVLDTPTGTTNPDGTPVLAPYFAGATVGSITVTGATG
jgi:hypothetical protein